MSDLRITLTDRSIEGRETTRTVEPHIRDVEPSSITQLEAEQTLSVVETFLNGTTDHPINLDRLGICVGRSETTLGGLQGRYPVLQSRIDALRHNQHAVQAATVRTLPLPISQVTQIPSSNEVSRHGINLNVDFLSTTAPGFRSGTIFGGSVVASWNLYLLNGGDGSLAFTFGAGARGVFGDGSTLASAGGPNVRIGINGEVRLDFAPLSIFGELDVDAFAVFGRHQLPGRADWTHISQNLGIGGRALVGLRIFASPSTTIDLAWAPQVQHIPNAVTGISGDSQSLTYVSPLAFTLGVTHHPTNPRLVTGQVVCDSAEAPESVQNRVSEISTQIQELRARNGQLRQQVLQLYPSLNFNSIVDLGDIPEFSNRERLETVRSIVNCQELSEFLSIYERKRNRLREQNSRLQGIQEGRERLVPPVLTDTQRLRALNISVDGRFDARHTALILQNRELIEHLSHESNPRFTDTRPIAVVLEATADYNGAFQSQTAKPINVLAEDSRFFTLYYQANNTTELRNILTNLRQITGRGIHTLIIAGHGNRRSLQLGPDVNQDIQSLDSRDVARGDEDYFRSVMDLNEGELVLHSCSNGGVRDPNDRDPTHGLASEIYDRVDGINILSMGRPGNIQTFRIRNNLTVDIQWSDAHPSFMYRHHLPPGLLNSNSVTRQVSTGQTP